MESSDDIDSDLKRKRDENNNKNETILSNEKNTNSIVVITCYCYKRINPESTKQSILDFISTKEYYGKIILAEEGINAQVSYHQNYGEKSFEDFLVNTLSFEGINFKYNYSSAHPFKRHLIWRSWKEIIPMGVKDLDVNGFKGDYLNAEEWDEMVQRENSILIDTRNDYEIAFGTFQSAINPKTDTFKEFPHWVIADFIPNIDKYFGKYENSINVDNYKKLKEYIRNKGEMNVDDLNDEKLIELVESCFSNVNISMCCTGGVRCEKSTALMRKIGFKNVYHLKGGIIQYLAESNNKNNQWNGECFVFDSRMAVKQNLEPIQDKDKWKQEGKKMFRIEE